MVNGSRKELVLHVKQAVKLVQVSHPAGQESQVEVPVLKYKPAVHEVEHRFEAFRVYPPIQPEHILELEQAEHPTGQALQIHEVLFW